MKSHLRISERHSKAALFASTTAVLTLVLAGVLFAAELDTPGHLWRRHRTKTATLSIPSNDADDR